MTLAKAALKTAPAFPVFPPSMAVAKTAKEDEKNPSRKQQQAAAS
jgi:hypothetical protein